MNERLQERGTTHLLNELQDIIKEQDEQIESLQKSNEAGIRQAIFSEREACAALVEADGRVHPKAPDAVWAKTVAKLIRARGNHGQD